MRVLFRSLYAVAPLALGGVVACSFSSSTKAAGGDGGAQAEAGSGSDGASTPDGASPSDGGSGGGDAATPPPAAGGTGAFGIVTVDGKQKMYLPTQALNDAGNAMIAVVDVGVKGNGTSGAPALITTIDLGTTDYATTTGGDATMVVAASTQSNHVWFIDPTTDKLVKSIDLDATYGTSSFSGGGGYVTGIAADSAHHRAILSVWNGFALVDTTSQSITSVIQAPPSENFGFDSVHQRIFAPFYDCPNAQLDAAPPPSCNVPQGPGDAGVMPAGLEVIDLADGTVYTYEDPAAVDPLNPLGSEPDSASADPNTQIVVVPDEGTAEGVLDFSKAVFDKGTKTVTAPHVVLSGFSYEGVAVEASTHLAFWEAESSNLVAVADLVRAAKGDQAWVGGTMPDLPGGAGAFSTVLDPHGIAVTTSIVGGAPVGFLVDSSFHWVARVDLQGLAKLEQGDASITADQGQMAGVVTYLDATTAP